MILHLAALLLMHATNSGTDSVMGDLQILQRAPRMADFRMASSRVGAEGGIALAQGLSTGHHTYSFCAVCIYALKSVVLQYCCQSIKATL